MTNKRLLFEITESFFSATRVTVIKGKIGKNFEAPEHEKAG
jgi:hypothetical protein